MNDSKKNNKGLLKRYAEKTASIITKPISKKVEVYKDPNWENKPIQKKGLVRRAVENVADRVIRGSQTLKDNK